MALLNKPFHASQAPTSDNFAPLPAGWYRVSVNSADLKQTRSGTGEYISVRYDILGPTHQGRTVFDNFNIKNKSSRAEEIGWQQLGEMMRAGGIESLHDTEQLVGLNLQVKLAIRPASDQYEASNDVKAYKAIDGSAPPAAQAQGEAPAQPAPGNAPPWKK